MSDTAYNSNNNDNSKSWIWAIIVIVFLVAIAIVVTIVLTRDTGDPMLQVQHVKTEQELIKNTPYLIYETNFPLRAHRCLSSQNYGVNNNGDFYIKNGCSGIFLYRDSDNNDYLGTCTTSETNKNSKICPIGRMDPTISPIQKKQISDPVNPIYTIKVNDRNTNLNGLIRKDDKNIRIMKQNGLCTPDNYGFYGNNMIYTDNGCDGIFRIGPLIGECGSNTSDPTTPPQMTKCPIGYKKEINGKQMGLVLTDLKSNDRSNKCQDAPNSYGYRDIDTGFRDLNHCRGDMIFGTEHADNTIYAKYEVSCKTDEANCDLTAVKE